MRYLTPQPESLRVADFPTFRNISVEPALRNDLPLFREMEQEEDTAEFVYAYSLEEHKKAFETPGISYLRISQDGVPIGFFLLAVEEESRSVEFRRIVIQPAARGVGQIAIRLMHQYCRDQLGCTRIWLDVFEQNARAVHVYEKLGYRRFGVEESGAKRLALYERQLNG